MFSKNQSPFSTEIENTQKTLDKKLHFSKNTCKALISLFENIANIEDQYSKSLKQLLQSGSGAFKISLTQSKEDDIGAIKGAIDVFLSGMLQISQNHGLLSTTIRNETLKQMKQLLESLRETKKSCLSEVDQNVKKQYDRLSEKLKQEQSISHSLDKKVGSSRKTQEEIEIHKQKSLVAQHNLEFRVKEVEEFETVGRKKLLEIIEKAESIDVSRAYQTKAIFIDHITHLMQTTKSDTDLSHNLFRAFEKNNLQVEFDDLSIAKGNLGFKQSSSLPPPQVDTSTKPKVESSNSSPNLYAPQRNQDSMQIDLSQRALAPSNQAIQLVDQATSPAIWENQSPQFQVRNQDPSPELPQQQYQPAVFASRPSAIVSLQNDAAAEFGYNRILFAESGSSFNDLMTKFDLKYFNTVLYILFSSHLKLENYGKKIVEKEDLTLMSFKNKMRLNLREVKILDKAFKIQVKSQIAYKQNKFEKQGLLYIILENIKRFVSKKESKIRDTLQKKEDCDFLISTIKHLFVLIIENERWIQESRKKLGHGILSDREQESFNKSCETILKFFFKEKPLDYKDFSFKNEVLPIFQDPIFLKQETALSFPINLQMCETLVLSLIDVSEENQLFVDDWEITFKAFMKFIEDGLNLNEDISSFIILEHVFNRYIKPNIVQRESDVLDYFAKIKGLVAKTLESVRKAEFENAETFGTNNESFVARKSLGFAERRSLGFSERPTNQLINKYIICNFAKDIWINCVKLLENFRKLIPPKDSLIQGVLEIAYCSFFSQNEMLKEVDFLESVSRAFETCGVCIATEYQMRFKNHSTSRKNSHQQTMEYVEILESLEEELKQSLESYMQNFLRVLLKIMHTPKDMIERKIKESFAKGCMDELAFNLNKNLALDQKNGELEEDIITIANQLGRIDNLLHKAGVTNANFTDLCSVALEKWFISYTNKSKQFASKIIEQERWLDAQENSSHTNTPVDLCYLLFNPIQIFKKMSEGAFKEKSIQKFEIAVFEVLTKYFDNLSESLDPILNSLTQAKFKKIAVVSGKKKPTTIKQNEFDFLESKEQLEKLQSEISRLSLRLGNLSFIHKEVEGSFFAIFGEKSNLIHSLRDFAATYFKRISKKLCKIIVMNHFRNYFFRFLYLNLNDSVLGSKAPSNFRDEYEFCAAHLLGNLVPIMKALKTYVPEQYFSKFLLELVEPFLNEYIIHLVDPEKASRENQNKYADFLLLEIDSLVEFFFPMNSAMMVSQSIKIDQISERFASAFKVAGFFKINSTQLVHKYQEVNPLADSEYMYYKAIPRVMALRHGDSVASQFLKHYHEIY